MPLNVDEAVQRLLEGNQRYTRGRSIHPNQGFERREEVQRGQTPFAVILGCSDSRVPPEIIFDQGVGDLFVIRVAGNIVDDAVLGSIEYAAEHLGVGLVVVLGHQRCGAVQTAVKGGEARGHVTALIEAISPAVYEARTLPGDLVDNAIRASVRRSVSLLRTSRPLLGDLVRGGKLEVIGAYYRLEGGTVEIVGE